MDRKKGVSRPGALQMILALLLMACESSGPIFIAATRPEHYWEMIVTGWPAVALSLGGIAAVLIYIVGFVRYLKDKGYSLWLSVWLLLANVPGFVAMLLLPDIGEARLLETERSKFLHKENTATAHQ